MLIMTSHSNSHDTYLVVCTIYVFASKQYVKPLIPTNRLLPERVIIINSVQFKSNTCSGDVCYYIFVYIY